MTASADVAAAPAAPATSASPSASALSPSPLLTGPLLPKLLRFALPNMVAMLATAMATIAETGFVGSFGVSALAGMALVFPFVMLQQMLSAGAMGGGVSSAISRALGAGDAAKANALAVHALWIGLAMGLVMTAIMLTCGPVLFRALGGQGEALAQALAFANIAFLGCTGMWVVNTLASVIRGSGNMRIPSFTLLALAAVQVLVGGAFGLGWFGLPRGGMAGVALGQLVANLGGALFLWRYLQSPQSTIALRIAATSLQTDLLKDILRVGAVACLSPLLTVLTILVLTYFVGQFGTHALAGYGIGTRLEFLLVPLAFAVGVASMPLVGMAIGAGLIARARQAAWLAALVTFLGLSTLGLLVALQPQLWSGIFTQDALVLALAASYFQWVGPCYGLFGLGLCLYFSSLGAGHAKGPVLAGALRLVLIAVGGWWLTHSTAHTQAATWSIFALAGLGMAVYGLAMIGVVYVARWGKG